MSVLRLPAVCAAVGLSKSTIHFLVQQGQFPAPVKLSSRASGWPSDEVEEWVHAKSMLRSSCRHAPMTTTHANRI